MNRREFLAAGCGASLVGCGGSEDMAQDFTLQPSPRRVNDLLQSPVYGYGEYLSPSVTTSGAIATNIRFGLVRIGNMINLVSDEWTGTATAASPNITLTGVIPVGWRPYPDLIYFPIGVVDNNAVQDTPGVLRIGPDGTIQVLKTISGGSNFTSGTIVGVLGYSVVYNIVTRFY